MSFVKLADAERLSPVDGAKVRFIHSENMTLAYWEFIEGAVLPSHSHPHEQVANVIEGELDLTVGGQTRRCTLGDVAVIPGGVEHSAVAVTACRVIDVFYPVREDYK